MNSVKTQIVWPTTNISLFDEPVIRAPAIATIVSKTSCQRIGHTCNHNSASSGRGRPKIIAAASKKFVCIADASKLVDVLGTFPLPVEVIPMARSYVARELVKLGGTPVWRENFVTDNGNLILDVHHMAITEPAKTESTINQIVGVVTVGLFAQRPADVLILGSEQGPRIIEP